MITTTHKGILRTNIIGIIGHTLYIDGLYAGDHFHTSIITDSTKKDLLSRGVLEFGSFVELDKFYEDLLYNEMIGS